MSRNIKIYVAYLVSFSLVFLPILGGAGNFWDWTFPYFSTDISRYFDIWSTSWEMYNLGQTLGYTSDIFFRFIISLATFVQPEFLQYMIYVLVTTAAACGGFLVSSTRIKDKSLTILIGLVCVANPIITYKIFAGHIDYLASYAIFLYFIYFLISRYKNTLRDILIVALFIALGGIQLQFFVFLFIFYIIYLIAYKYRLRLSHIIVLIVPIVINLPWLTNFLIGAYPLGELIETVKSTKHVFDLNRIRDILSFQVARETRIADIFSLYVLPFFASLWAFALGGYIYCRPKNTPIPIVFAMYAIVMTYLVSGQFHNLHIPLLSTFFPMFREVGHFAGPLIVMIIFLASYVYQRKIWGTLLYILFSGMVLVSSYTIIREIPSIDFSYIREQFDYIHQFAQQTENQGTYRILYYPFFSQYTFRELPHHTKGGSSINNAGRDSFIKFGPQAYIENQLVPEKFTGSIQYKLASKQVSPAILQEYNIQYLYDLSDTYQSLYNQYVPQDTYGGNASIFAVNTSFVSHLAKDYPTILTPLGLDVYKISNTLPRIFGTSLQFYKQAPYSYLVWVDDLQSFTGLYFLESYNAFREFRAISYKPLDCKNAIQRTENNKECISVQGPIPSLWSAMKGISIPGHTGYNVWAQQWNIDTGTKLSIAQNMGLSQKNNKTGMLLMLYYKPQLYYIVARYLSLFCMLICVLYLCIRYGKKNI